VSVALNSCALLLAAATAASTADSGVQELFNKARARVLDSAHRLPHYTCVETISRAQYFPPQGGPNSCPALIARRRLVSSPGSLAMHDRLRLDVAVTNGGEIFSWAGAGKFETQSVDKLIGGGASGSGDFGSFLGSVFGNDPDAIRYQGLRNNLALFNYNVPLAKSAYTYHGPSGPDHTIGFHGNFSVDPSDGDLEQLVVEANEFAPADIACRVEHVMNYQRVKIGSGDFLLPEISTMKALYRNGAESDNETHYSDCREYVGESTIRFDDVDPASPALVSKAAVKPLPAKTRLEVTLAKSINTELGAAGDEVTAIASFGVERDRIHGRILRFAQFMTPMPHWIVALRFDSIDRGGVSQPLSLKPLDVKRTSQFPELPADAGVFTFDARGNLTLDQTFRSFWETR
jgi:hypothetical protein